MRLTLRHKLPFVVGAVVVLTIGSGMVAYALGASAADDRSTKSGNTQPIDDNHKSIGTHDRRGAGDAAIPSATPKRSDDSGVDPTDDPTTDSRSGPGDHRGVPTTPRPADGNGTRGGGSGRSGTTHGSGGAPPKPTGDHHGAGTGSGHGSGGPAPTSTGSGSPGRDNSGHSGGGHGSDG